MATIVMVAIFLIASIVSFLAVHKVKKADAAKQAAFDAKDEKYREWHSRPESRETLPVTVCGFVCLVIAVVALVFGCITQIPTGYTGIVVSFGKVEDVTLDAGFHFMAPWKSIVKMDNREQRIQVTLSAFSKDIQQVDTQLSINYAIDKQTAMNLYREVGTGYLDTLVNPRISEAVKNCYSGYAAEELISKRNELSDHICAALQDELTAYGINISSVSIEDIDFTDAFTDAVEAKQVATQTKLKAETEQAQRTMEAEQEAERKKIEAEAAAEVVRIEADAERYKVEQQAAANVELGKSLTESLIDYTRAVNWDGKLPSTYTVLGEGTESAIVVQ